MIDIARKTVDIIKIKLAKKKGHVKIIFTC